MSCGSMVGATLRGLPPVGPPYHSRSAVRHRRRSVGELIVAVLKMKFGAGDSHHHYAPAISRWVRHARINPPFKDMTPGAAPYAIGGGRGKAAIILPRPNCFGIILACCGGGVLHLHVEDHPRRITRVIGMNPNAGRYSGMNIPNQLLLSAVHRRRLRRRHHQHYWTPVFPDRGIFQQLRIQRRGRGRAPGRMCQSAGNHRLSEHPVPER